ncbi:MAG: hypothetical protein ACI9CU_002019, partial [Polaribacter sp.]
MEKAVALHSYIQGIVDFSDEEMEIIMSHFKPMSLPSGEYFVDEGLI